MHSRFRIDKGFAYKGIQGFFEAFFLLFLRDILTLLEHRFLLNSEELYIIRNIFVSSTSTSRHSCGINLRLRYIGGIILVGVSGLEVRIYLLIVIYLFEDLRFDFYLFRFRRSRGRCILFHDYFLDVLSGINQLVKFYFFLTILY